MYLVIRCTCNEINCWGPQASYFPSGSFFFISVWKSLCLAVLLCSHHIFTFCYVFCINIHRLKLSSQVLNQISDSSPVMYHFTIYVSEATRCDKPYHDTWTHQQLVCATWNITTLWSSSTKGICFSLHSYLGSASCEESFVLIRATFYFILFIFFNLIEQRECLLFIS